MERAMVLQHLAQAERHVAEGEQRVARQRMLVAQLKQDGHDIVVAVQLLRQFEDTLAMQSADRERIRAELSQLVEGRVG